MTWVHDEHAVVNQSPEGVLCQCGVLWADIHRYGEHLLAAAGEPPEEATRMLQSYASAGRPMHFNRRGEPINWWQWAVLYEDIEYKRIGSEYLVGSPEFDMDDDTMLWVSTVWLGYNHSWGRGDPVLFETMIFDGPYAGEMTRYCTEDEARQGHTQTVADLIAGHAPWFLRDHLEGSEH